MRLLSLHLILEHEVLRAGSQDIKWEEQEQAGTEKHKLAHMRAVPAFDFDHVEA